MNSDKEETNVKEIKSPGMAFKLKLIKKKVKQMDDKMIPKQMKFVLISLTVQISEMVPSNLITF